MSLDRAIDFILAQAAADGAPISRACAERIAAQLLGLRHVHDGLPPGEIARKHRQRYEEDWLR